MQPGSGVRLVRRACAKWRLRVAKCRYPRSYVWATRMPHMTKQLGWIASISPNPEQGRPNTT